MDLRQYSENVGQQRNPRNQLKTFLRTRPTWARNVRHRRKTILTHALQRTRRTPKTCSWRRGPNLRTRGLDRDNPVWNSCSHWDAWLPWYNSQLHQQENEDQQWETGSSRDGLCKLYEFLGSQISGHGACHFESFLQRCPWTQYFEERSWVEMSWSRWDHGGIKSEIKWDVELDRHARPANTKFSVFQFVLVK